MGNHSGNRIPDPPEKYDPDKGRGGKLSECLLDSVTEIWKETLKKNESLDIYY